MHSVRSKKSIGNCGAFDEPEAPDDDDEEELGADEASLASFSLVAADELSSPHSPLPPPLPLPPRPEPGGRRMADSLSFRLAMVSGSPPVETGVAVVVASGMYGGIGEVLELGGGGATRPDSARMSENKSLLLERSDSRSLGLLLLLLLLLSDDEDDDDEDDSSFVDLSPDDEEADEFAGTSV